MAARSTEERIALIDAKISKKQDEIKALEAQKQKLLHPVTMRSVMEKPLAYPRRRSRRNWGLKCDVISCGDSRRISCAGHLFFHVGIAVAVGLPAGVSLTARPLCRTAPPCRPGHGLPVNTAHCRI